MAGHANLEGQGVCDGPKRRRRAGQAPDATLGEVFCLDHSSRDYGSGTGTPFGPDAAVLWHHLVLQRAARRHYLQPFYLYLRRDAGIHDQHGLVFLSCRYYRRGAGHSHRLYRAAHQANRATMARLHRHGSGGHTRPGHRYWLFAHVLWLSGALVGKPVFCHLVGGYRHRSIGSPPALCAARLHGSLAAGKCFSGGIGRESRSKQIFDRA